MPAPVSYREPILRVLSLYPPGESLVTALTTLLNTAQERARIAARDEIAMTVCEGLHVGPAAGLKCRKCYEVEQRLGEEAAVESERIAADPAAEEA